MSLSQNKCAWQEQKLDLLAPYCYQEQARSRVLAMRNLRGDGKESAR